MTMLVHCSFVNFLNLGSMFLESPFPVWFWFGWPKMMLCVFWKVEAKHNYYTLMIISLRQWEIELQVASSCSSLFRSLCLALLPQWQIYWLPSASGSSPDALLWTHRDNSHEKPIPSQGFLHLPPFMTLILQLDGAYFQISMHEPNHSPVRDG